MDFQNWSSWLQEGYYISFPTENGRVYEHIIARDWAHWEYTWPEIIPVAHESGPFTPDDLEITRGYTKASNMNQIWQVLFGIKGQVYIYIELPTDLHRHGIPKVPKPGTALREVSHFEEWMSPFMEPSFLTEHFMMRSSTQQMTLTAYNPKDIPQTPVLNFMIAKLQTERIGSETYEDGGTVLTPSSSRWKDTLDRLYKRAIPHRPLTLEPVRADAVAPAGE